MRIQAVDDSSNKKNSQQENFPTKNFFSNKKNANKKMFRIKNVSDKKFSDTKVFSAKNSIALGPVPQSSASNVHPCFMAPHDHCHQTRNRPHWFGEACSANLPLEECDSGSKAQWLSDTALHMTLWKSCDTRRHKGLGKGQMFEILQVQVPPNSFNNSNLGAFRGAMAQATQA